MSATSSRKRHVPADAQLQAVFAATPWRLEWSERSDGTKTWELRRRTGARERIVFKTLEEAREHSARWTLGQRVPKSNVTLRMLTERYRAARSESLAPNTVRTVDSYLDLHVLPHFGSTPARDVDTESIVHWLRGLRCADGKPMASGSKQKVLAALLMVLRYGVETANALVAVPTIPKQFRPAKSKPGGRVLTDDEVDRVFAACPPWLQDAADVTLAQALRVGEVCGLQWGDVDFAAKTMTVARQAQDGEYRPTKTGTVETIHLRPRAHEVLLRMRNEMESKPRAADPIFPNRWSKSVASTFRKHARNAGVVASIHDLRRTVITELANTPGIPLAVVRDFARHSSLEETQKYVRAGHTPVDVLAALDGNPTKKVRRVA